MDDDGTARRETIRYHEALYNRPDDAAAAGWAARPHGLVVDAVARVSEPVHAYDLGAGAGRHSVLMAGRLPLGSRVTAVDLLPSGLDRLTETAARAGVADRIEVVEADLENYRFPARDAGIILAFSVLEHLSTDGALTAVLGRCRDATLPGGIIVTAIFADRVEVTARGSRPAPVECPLSAERARDALASACHGWEVLVDRSTPTAVREVRGGEAYDLRATMVAFVARARRRSPGMPPAP